MEECIDDLDVRRGELHRQVRLLLKIEQLPAGSRTLLNRMQARLRNHEDALSYY